MATQKTTFVVDADIRTAARGLDELAAKEEKVQRGFKAIGDAAQNMEIKVAAANRKVAEAVQGPRVTAGGGYVAAPSRAMGAYGIAPAVLPAAAKITGGYGGPGGHVIAAPAGGGYGYGVAGEDPLAFGAAAIERMRQIQAIKPTAENDPHAARLRAAEIAAKVAAESRASMAKRHSASAQLEVQLWEANYAREQREAAERMAVSQNAHSIAQQVARESRASMAARAAAKEDDANRWEVAKFEHHYERVQAGKRRQQESNRAGMMMLGTATVGAAMYVGGEMIAGHEAARERVLGFTNDFRKVASLGDNYKNMGKKRGDLLNYSTAYGVGTDKVSAAMYDIESAASNLTEAEQKDLMLGGLQFNRLQGTDIGIGAKAILKYNEIYKGSGIKSINQAKNRLYKTADLGDLEIQSFATLAPDLLARAKAMNVSDTTALASTIAATQKLGRPEKTLTSLGDFYMKAPEASKKLGIELKGTLDDLDKLAKFKPEQLVDAFGTEVGMARVLIDNRAEIRRLNEELKAVGPTADEVGAKLKKMWSDSAMAYSESMASIEEAKKNLPLTSDWQKNWAQADLQMNYRELGLQNKLGPSLGFMAKPYSMYQGASDAIWKYANEASWYNPAKYATWLAHWPLRVGLAGIEAATGDNEADGRRVVDEARAAAGRKDASEESVKNLDKAAKNMAVYSRGAYRLNAHVE